MKRLFSLNTSLYLMLIAFVMYFAAEKIGEIQPKRHTVSAEKESVQADPQNFVSPLVGLDMSGRQVEIAFKNQPQPTVVYVFSPVCHYCELNEGNFAAIFEGAKNTHRFIGVATVTTGLSDYIAHKAIMFPVLTHVRKGDWKLALTPQMVVVSAEGRLLKNWMGLQDRRKWELEEYFGLRLPGPTKRSPQYSLQEAQ